MSDNKDLLEIVVGRCSRDCIGDECFFCSPQRRRVWIFNGSSFHAVGMNTLISFVCCMKWRWIFLCPDVEAKLISLEVSTLLSVRSSWTISFFYALSQQYPTPDMKSLTWCAIVEWRSIGATFFCLLTTNHLNENSLLRYLYPIFLSTIEKFRSLVTCHHDHNKIIVL
jgi:hypothetical protein